MLNNISNNLSTLLVSASLILNANSLAQNNNSNTSNKFREQIIIDNREAPSFVRSQAYWVFGSKYYLPDMGYPIANFDFEKKDLAGHDIKLKKGAKKCPDAGESGWAQIPIGSHSYYRAEYQLKDLDISFDEWIKEMTDNYTKRGFNKSYDETQRNCLENRSKIHVALFPKSDFNLKFHPGSYLLIHPNGEQFGDKISPRKGLEVKKEYTKILPEELESLVGLFNGTFWNQDTIRKVNGEERRAGLIIEGVVVDEPINGLATLAFYNDGNFKIGLYEEMPDKEKIKLMRQNENILLHNGEFNEKGSYHALWRNFNDEILVSYFISDLKEEYFGYAWTTHTPPSVFTKTMRYIGFSEVYMIDIHPVINSVLASPRKDEKEKFSTKNSYAFVPIEEDVVNTLVRTLTIKIKGPIQYNPYTPLYFSEKDFFSVELKE